MVVDVAAAFGPRNTWAFGTTMPENGGAQVPYATSFNGRAWQLVRIPGVARAVSATSPHDLWVVGPTRRTADKALASQVLIAMRWNGRSWLTTTVPRSALPQHGTLDASAAAAAGPDDLWWCYQVSVDSGPSHVGLLRWDAGRWQQIAVPAIADVTAMTQDGAGGVWLLADADSGGSGNTQYWYHYSGGRWTRQPVPSPRGYGSTLFSMSWIPGTRDVWAVGEADGNVVTNTIGIIARYGRSGS